LVDFDAARWKKSFAQITEVIGLLATLPADHPRHDPWLDHLQGLKNKVKRRKLLGKREQATVDNIEFFLTKLMEISSLLPEESSGQ